MVFSPCLKLPSCVTKQTDASQNYHSNVLDRVAEVGQKHSDLSDVLMARPQTIIPQKPGWEDTAIYLAIVFCHLRSTFVLRDYANIAVGNDQHCLFVLKRTDPASCNFILSNHHSPSLNMNIGCSLYFTFEFSRLPLRNSPSTRSQT